MSKENIDLVETSSDEELQAAAAPAPVDDSAYSSAGPSGTSGSSSEGSTGEKSKTPSPAVDEEAFEFHDILSAVDGRDLNSFARLIDHPDCCLDCEIDMGDGRINSLYRFLDERCDDAAFDAFFKMMLATYYKNLDKHLVVTDGVLDRNSQDIVWRLFETSSVVALDALCKKVNEYEESFKDVFYEYLGICISTILQRWGEDRVAELLKLSLVNNAAEIYGILFDATPPDRRVADTGPNVVFNAFEKNHFDVAKKFFKKDPERLFDKAPNGLTPLKMVIGANIGHDDVAEIDFRDFIIDSTVSELGKLDDARRVEVIESMRDGNGRSALFDAVDVLDWPCFSELLSVGFGVFDAGNDRVSVFDYVCRKYEELARGGEDLSEITFIVCNIHQSARLDQDSMARRLDLGGGNSTTFHDVARKRFFAELRSPGLADSVPRAVAGTGNIAPKIVRRARGIPNNPSYHAEI